MAKKKQHPKTPSPVHLNKMSIIQANTPDPSLDIRQLSELLTYQHPAWNDADTIVLNGKTYIYEPDVNKKFFSEWDRIDQHMARLYYLEKQKYIDRLPPTDQYKVKRVTEIKTVNGDFIELTLDSKLITVKPGDNINISVCSTTT